MLRIKHIPIERPKNLFIASSQMQAATYSWNCIFLMISDAFRFYHADPEFHTCYWDEKVEDLHSALSSIEGNICDIDPGGFVECDACDFAHSINTLIRFGMLDDYEDIFIQNTGDTIQHACTRRQINLRLIFPSPFQMSFRNQREYLEIKLQPKDYDDAIQYLERAHLRIQWLRGIMKNVNAGLSVTRGELPAPPAFYINDTQQQQQNISSNPNAQAAALGGGGGKADSGAAATIGDIAPKQETTQNVAPVIGTGAIQNSNAVTNNIAGQGDIVRETRETVFQTLEWVKGNPGVVLGAINRGADRSNDAGGNKSDNKDQEKADAALWAEWETAKAAKIQKAKFAADRGMTANEVQNGLDRHRKRLEA